MATLKRHSASSRGGHCPHSTAAGASHLLCSMLVMTLSACMFASVMADCPDYEMRCRIPVAEVLTKGASRGCEIGGGASGGVIGNVPSANVNINGKCFYTEKSDDGTEFVPMGTIMVAHCWRYQFGDVGRQSCRPCNEGGSLAECSERVIDCKLCRSGCTQTYVVQPGDSCWRIADSNGMSTEQLVSMNPGLECNPLSLDQEVCLEMGTAGECTNKCEAEYTGKSRAMLNSTEPMTGNESSNGTVPNVTMPLSPMVMVPSPVPGASSNAPSQSPQSSPSPSPSSSSQTCLSPAIVFMVSCIMFVLRFYNM